MSSLGGAWWPGGGPAKAGPAEQAELGCTSRMRMASWREASRQGSRGSGSRFRSQWDKRVGYSLPLSIRWAPWGLQNLRQCLRAWERLRAELLRGRGGSGGGRAEPSLCGCSCPSPQDLASKAVGRARFQVRYPSPCC